MSTSSEPATADRAGGELAERASPAAVGDLRGACEAVLMVAEEPVAEAALAAAVDQPVPAVRQVVAELAAEYDEQRRGFCLAQVAGGWRVLSRAEHADAVSRFVSEGQTARLSQAALETLAVVAYRQPVSRARVAAIRAVSVDGVFRTLAARGLIDEVGSDESTGARLYGTTTLFLERMGLYRLEDLAPLAPCLPDAELVAELAEGTR